jgi:hypothetical protein
MSARGCITAWCRLRAWGEQAQAYVKPMLTLECDVTGIVDQVGKHTHKGCAQLEERRVRGSMANMGGCMHCRRGMPECATHGHYKCLGSRWVRKCVAGWALTDRMHSPLKATLMPAARARHVLG